MKMAYTYPEDTTSSLLTTKAPQLKTPVVVPTYTPTINPYSYSGIFRTAASNIYPGQTMEDKGYQSGIRITAPGAGNLDPTVIGGINQLESGFANEFYKKAGRFPTSEESQAFVAQYATPDYATGVMKGNIGLPQITSQYIPSYLAANPSLIPSTTPTNAGYTPSIDSKLSVDSIMGQLDKPTSDIVSAMIAPQMPMLRRESGELLASAQSKSISDFAKRGLTGSSTELGTTYKDLVAEAEKNLLDKQTKLMTDLYPVALQEKQMGITTGLSLRKLVTDEQFNSMTLEQKDKLAAAENQLKRDMQQIDKDYEVRINEAKMNFQSAETEKQRQFAQEQMAKIESDMAGAKKMQIWKGLLTLTGGVAGGILGSGEGDTMGGVKAGLEGGGILSSFIM
jgi:hypothetical protein